MIFDADAAFAAAFEQALADEAEGSGFPIEKWFKSGVSKPEVAADKWRENGPGLVRNFIRWYESSGEQVWITPDGRAAIELELMVEFNGIPVRAFVDLVTVGPLGLTIIDTKAGYKDPDSPQQLGMYACCVELAYGAAYRPLWGAFFKARGSGPKGASAEEKTYLQPRIGLDSWRFSVGYFAQELAKFESAAERELYIARPGEHCNICGVNYACTAVGGSDAWKHDPAHPGFGSPVGELNVTG